MANPLFNRLFGGTGTSFPAGADPSSTTPNTPTTPQNQGNMSMMDAMQQLRSDPMGMIKKAGYNVPDEIAGNPQATVMHLIQSGQIGGPMMQRIQPMLNMLMGKR